MADPNTPDTPYIPDDPDDTYEPSSVEINLAREQGLGMGEKDLEGQRDPTGEIEQFSRKSDSELDEAKRRDKAGKD
ncbi:MAG TPA: hypothetical protein VHX64_12065 [Caulobacteraceae bacterium]|nr:hypothetical protein [Caulobacteraceae bacterium]